MKVKIIIPSNPILPGLCKELNSNFSPVVIMDVTPLTTVNNIVEEIERKEGIPAGKKSLYSSEPFGEPLEGKLPTGVQLFLNISQEPIISLSMKVQQQIFTFESTKVKMSGALREFQEKLPSEHKIRFFTENEIEYEITEICRIIDKSERGFQLTAIIGKSDSQENEYDVIPPSAFELFYNITTLANASTAGNVTSSLPILSIGYHQNEMHENSNLQWRKSEEEERILLQKISYSGGYLRNEIYSIASIPPDYYFVFVVNNYRERKGWFVREGLSFGQRRLLGDYVLNDQRTKRFNRSLATLAKLDRDDTRYLINLMLACYDAFQILPNTVYLFTNMNERAINSYKDHSGQSIMLPIFLLTSTSSDNPNKCNVKMTITLASGKRRGAVHLERFSMLKNGVLLSAFSFYRIDKVVETGDTPEIFLTYMDVVHHYVY